MDKALEDYFKGELLSHLAVLLIGVIYVVLSIILLRLNNKMYSGLAFSLIPFGVTFIIINITGVAKFYKKKISIKNANHELIEENLKEEQSEILAFLSTYEKHITFFSAILVLSMIFIFACFLSSINEHLAGLSVGICLSAVILLCYRLITGFRKRLFLHDIRKYFSN